MSRDYIEELAISGDSLLIKPVSPGDKPVYGKASIEIALSKDQLDIAKSCNISNDEYATQYLMMKIDRFRKFGELLYYGGKNGTRS